MVLLTEEEFEKAEHLLAALLVTANEREQGKILALHDRVKVMFAAQTDRRSQLEHLRSLKAQRA